MCEEKKMQVYSLSGKSKCTLSKERAHENSKKSILVFSLFRFLQRIIHKKRSL